MSPACPSSGRELRALRPAWRRVAALAAWFVLFISAGVATAAWTANGTGNGTAKAITAVSVTVTTDTSQTADLYPGGPAGTLAFKVDNVNPYAITFTSMTPGAVTVDSSHSSCTPASYLTVTARTGLSISVPANTPTASPAARSVSSAVSMSSSAPDACQGAVFTIAVTLSGSSA